MWFVSMTTLLSHHQNETADHGNIINNKMEDEAVASDNIVTEFATYEDFLDSQITPLDLYYLEVIYYRLLTAVCCVF